MKKIRSYSSIWSVEKVIYAINDMRLPFPITFSQMAWFVACEFAVLALGGLLTYLYETQKTAVIAYRGGISEILWYSRCPHMVYEPKNVGRQEAVQLCQVVYGLPAAP